MVAELVDPPVGKARVRGILCHGQRIHLPWRRRRGARAAHAALYKPVEVKDRDSGEDATKVINLLRAFSLFNLDQTDGLEHLLGEVEAPAFRPIPDAEEIVSASSADIIERSRRAYYERAADRITLPERARFLKPEDFYATALHELTHWTGHASRLHREFGARFGDDAYAFEELVAEMGSAFLTARIGLRGELQHASYIDNWLGILRRDQKAFAHASALAQQAYDYVMESWLEAGDVEGDAEAKNVGIAAVA